MYQPRLKTPLETARAPQSPAEAGTRPFDWLIRLMLQPVPVTGLTSRSWLT